jgi:hypothetical protein
VTHASRTPLPVVFKASDLELVAGKQQTRLRRSLALRGRCAFNGEADGRSDLTLGRRSVEYVSPTMKQGGMFVGSGRVLGGVFRRPPVRQSGLGRAERYQGLGYAISGGRAQTAVAARTARLRLGRRLEVELEAVAPHEGYAQDAEGCGPDPVDGRLVGRGPGRCWCRRTPYRRFEEPP